VKSNNGHSSSTAIGRDIDKNNLLVSKGWRLISRQPNKILTLETLRIIQQLVLI